MTDHCKGHNKGPWLSISLILPFIRNKDHTKMPFSSFNLTIEEWCLFDPTTLKQAWYSSIWPPCKNSGPYVCPSWRMSKLLHPSCHKVTRISAKGATINNLGEGPEKKFEGPSPGKTSFERHSPGKKEILRGLAEETKKFWEALSRKIFLYGSRPLKANF